MGHGEESNVCDQVTYKQLVTKITIWTGVVGGVENRCILRKKTQFNAQFLLELVEKSRVRLPFSPFLSSFESQKNAHFV